jgi:hypothetical protein
MIRLFLSTAALAAMISVASADPDPFFDQGCGGTVCRVGGITHNIDNQLGGAGIHQEDGSNTYSGGGTFEAFGGLSEFGDQRCTGGGSFNSSSPTFLPGYNCDPF